MPNILNRVKIRYHSPEAFCAQYKKNIVHFGLFAPSPTPLPVDTPVELIITIPKVEEPFVIQGKVVSSVDEETAKATGWQRGMAFMFDREQKDRLKKLQDDLRRNKIYCEMLNLSDGIEADLKLKTEPRPEAKTATREGYASRAPFARKEEPTSAPGTESPADIKEERIDRMRKVIREGESLRKVEKQKDEYTPPPTPTYPAGDKIKRDFTLEERKQMEPVTVFVLNLVKAMLRSGYYAPDHPGSRKAKKGIYDEFIKVVVDRPDLTLFSRETRHRFDILISGVVEGNASLRELIGLEQAEIFIPKFKEYFNRKRLVSFSLKNSLALEQFEDFIDIMSDPKVDKGEEGEVGSLLTNALVERGITDVSTLFMDDIIILELKLPWRVELAIQRLAKDLKVLPMFKGKSEEEIQGMKIRIVKDIIRPLREPHLLKDIVVNCHVIAKHVAVIDTEDLERTIISSFPMEILVPTSEYVFEELKRIEGELEKNPGHPALIERLEGVKRILKWVSRRVVVEGISVNDKFFEQLYNYKILDFEELPDTVKSHVNALKLVKEFKETPSYYMKKFDDAKTEEDVYLFMTFFRRILPDMLDLGAYDLLLLVTKSVQAKFRHHPEYKLGRLASLEDPVQFIWEDSISILEKKFGGGKDEAMVVVKEIVELLGEYGVELLVHLLMQSQDSFVRKNAVKALINMGDDAINPIIKILKNPSNPWYLYRNALAVISQIGRESDLGIVGRFLRHSDFRVREEALNALGTGRFPLKSQWILTNLMDIIQTQEHKDSSDKLAPARLKAKAIETLALLGNATVTEDKKVEDVLLDIVRPKKRWSFRLSGGTKRSAAKKEEEYTIKIAALSALAKIGTRKSLPKLRKLSDKGDMVISKGAKQALSQIQLREVGKP